MRVMMNALVAVAVCFLAGQASAATLDAVRERGVVRCGVNPLGQSLATRDTQGRWVGFYPDACRAVAAAAAGDPEAVEFVVVGTSNRFEAVRSGAVDVLMEASTWTLSRDGEMGLTFGPAYFFDGQGFLVRRSSKVQRAADLKGQAVCVELSTTSVENLKSHNARHALDLRIQEFSTVEAEFAALSGGRCEAMTTDYTILASVMLSNASNPADYRLLTDLISKEPLSPVVREGDDRWADVVRWSVYALLEAEDLGITSANAVSLRASGSAEVRRFLGATPGIGKAVGLDDQWAHRIVKGVGNYAEVFDRNLGSGSPLKLPRGQNALWRNGGLLWAPPMR